MEEDKAAAYYEELTRKGGGAARFKQGLGFSTSETTLSSSSPSSSSFLSNFVRASSPTHASTQAQLQSIQNKLKKKSERSRHQSRSRDRDRDRYSTRPSRSRSRERDGDRDRSSRKPTKRRSRSRSRERDRDRDRDRDRRSRRTESSGGVRKLAKNRNAVDYTRLIQGYDKMTPAERVKAKMKLQLAETAEKDETKGSGWERFEFDKDAPLDDEEVEAADDDAALVKHIGKSFRFSAVEARKEDEIRAAHDEAMFGAPVRPMSTTTSDSEPDGRPNNKEEDESGPVTNLISEKVLAKQQGSWRDRARKV